MTAEEYAMRAGSAALWLSAAIYDLVADPAEQPTRATLRRDLRAVDGEVVDAAVEALAKKGFSEEHDGVLRLVQHAGWRLEVAARSARPRLMNALARTWDAPPGWYVAAAGEDLIGLPATLYAHITYASIGWGESDRDELVALYQDELPAAVAETAIDALLAYGAVTQSRVLDMASPPDHDRPEAGAASTAREWLRRKLRRP